MTNEHIIKEWLAYAMRDLEAGKYLMNMYPKPIEIICYHCQQSAEKFLKGYLVFQNQQPKRTHDLVLLNTQCLNYDIDFMTIEEDCIELVPYGVQVRYPYQLELTEADLMQAIKSTENIQKLIISKIKTPE